MGGEDRTAFEIATNSRVQFLGVTPDLKTKSLPLTGFYLNFCSLGVRLSNNCAVPYGQLISRQKSYTQISVSKPEVP